MAGFFIAFILSALAAAGYPLIRPASVSYAAPPLRHARTVAYEPRTVTDKIILRARAKGHDEQIAAWRHAQVLAAVAQRIAAARAQQAAQAPAPPAAPAFVGKVSTAGMSAFEACVIQRESGGYPTVINYSSGASGLFGMLMSTWNSLGLGYTGGWANGSWYGGARTAPVSVQEQGFNILYARDGTAPWSPYDGC